MTLSSTLAQVQMGLAERWKNHKQSLRKIDLKLRLGPRVLRPAVGDVVSLAIAGQCAQEISGTFLPDNYFEIAIRATIRPRSG